MGHSAYGNVLATGRSIRADSASRQGPGARARTIYGGVCGRAMRPHQRSRASTRSRPRVPGPVAARERLSVVVSTWSRARDPHVSPLRPVHRKGAVMKRLAVTSAFVYILAWIGGLVVASGGPKPDVPAATVAVYLAQHEHRAMLGHLLVDGIAGLALIAIALLVLRFVRPSDEKMAKLAFYAGLAAALTSLAQFVLGMTFNSGMLLALLELT